MSDTNNLPEGFKLMPRRGRDFQAQLRQYGLSEKGEIFDVKNGKILVAPEGESIITIREDTPGRQYESTFDIPTLLSHYFGEQTRLRQQDFDELVAISGLSADVCRELLDAGWSFETTTDLPNTWFKY